MNVLCLWQIETLKKYHLFCCDQWNMKFQSLIILQNAYIHSYYQIYSVHTFFLQFAGITVTKRHMILKESIDTLVIEDEAFSTIWTIISVAVFSFVFMPILSACLFKRVNSTLHPCYEIVNEEVEKEKKCCCWLKIAW